MTQITNLVDYQNPLDSWLASLEGKRDKLEKYYLEKLRILYPSWRARGDKLDARPEYFMLLAVILQNVRLSFMFMRGQLCDPEWWRRRESQFFGPQVNDQAYREALEGYQIMGRQYFATQVVSITEYTLATIATSGHGRFQLSHSSGFSNAYEYVLSRTSLLENYRDLFDLLRLVRNTFHSNGYFSGEEDTVKIYNGRQYDFKLGQQIRWDNDDMIVMTEWISDAMWEILNSPEVRSIPYVPVVQPHP